MKIDTPKPETKQIPITISTTSSSTPSSPLIPTYTPIYPVIPVSISAPASPIVEKKPEPVIEKKPEPVVAEKKPEPIVEKKPEGPFEQKLRQLNEMGFINESQNIELLVRFKGDMMQVVRQLLEN